MVNKKVSPLLQNQGHLQLVTYVRNSLSESICLENARQLAHASICNMHDAAHLHTQKKQTTYVFQRVFLNYPRRIKWKLILFSVISGDNTC